MRVSITIQAMISSEVSLEMGFPGVASVMIL